MALKNKMFAFEVTLISGRRAMISPGHVTSFVQKDGYTEVHMINRGLLKIRMPYDKFVEFLTQNLALTYFVPEEEDEDTEQ